jgi:hypothetical protein
MGVTFTTIFQAERKNATGISIPAEIIAALGANKKSSIVVSLNGYIYRTTIAVYGDKSLIPVSSAHREASGLAAGDEVEVTLELAAQADATEVFDALALRRRKEFVRQVEEAKGYSTLRLSHTLPIGSSSSTTELSQIGSSQIGSSQIGSSQSREGLA